MFWVILFVLLMVAGSSGNPVGVIVLLIIGGVRFSYIRSKESEESEQRIRKEQEDKDSENASWKRKARFELEELFRINDSLEKYLSTNRIIPINKKVKFPDYLDENSERLEKEFTDEELLKLIRLKKYIHQLSEENNAVYKFGIDWEENCVLSKKSRNNDSGILLSNKIELIQNYSDSVKIERSIQEFIRTDSNKEEDHKSLSQIISNLDSNCIALDSLALSLIIMKTAKNKIGYLTIYSVFDELGAFYDGYQKNSIKMLENINDCLLEVRNSLNRIDSTLHKISSELNSISDTLMNIESGVIELSISGKEISRQIAVGNLINAIGLIQRRKLLNKN